MKQSLDIRNNEILRSMKTKLESRLEELKKECQKGKERLMSLSQETNDLNATVLRISGAIQVLEELLENQENKNSRPKTKGVELAGIKKNNN